MDSMRGPIHSIKIVCKLSHLKVTAFYTGKVSADLVYIWLILMRNQHENWHEIYNFNCVTFLLVDFK